MTPEERGQADLLKAKILLKKAALDSFVLPNTVKKEALREAMKAYEAASHAARAAQKEGS